MEVDKYEEIKEERTEQISMTTSTATTPWNASYVNHLPAGVLAKSCRIFFLQDDDCVPLEFAPLPELMSLVQTLPKQYIYTCRSAVSSGGSNKSLSGNDIK